MIRPVVMLMGVALTAVLVTSARPSRAADQPADADLSAAKAAFEEGSDFFKRGQFGDAVAKFQAAYDKKPFGAFLFNAGAAYEMALRFPEAIQYYEKYLEKEPEAKDAKEVRERIEALKAQVAGPVPGAAARPAAVLPRVEAKGLVIVDSKPAGALIYLDDKKGGVFAKTPWQGSLPPRGVKLIVEAKGFKPEERSISPRTDKVYEVYIALSEEHFLGWVEVASNVAGADVFLDQREIGAIGRTPYTGHVKPGKHTIWLERQGYVPVMKEIEVQPGTAVTHMVTLEKVPNGWISVVGKQAKGGKLLVDGKPVCDTPCRHEVAPGKHKVEVDKAGFEEYEAEVEVQRSAETEMQVTFSAKPSRARAWTAAVLTALFVGGGTYVALQGLDIKKDIENDLKNTGRYPDSQDPRGQKGKYYYIGANALWGIATVTGVISAINFLSSGPDSTAEVDTRSVGLAPMGQGTGAGVFAGGRF